MRKTPLIFADAVPASNSLDPPGLNPSRRQRMRWLDGITEDAVSATMRLQGQAQVVFPDAWARVTELPGREDRAG